MQLLTSLSTEYQVGPDTQQKTVQNTQAFKVHFHPKQYIIETNQKAVTISKYLVIDRENGNVSEKDGTPPKSEQSKGFSAFLGTIYILDKAFLLLVEETSQTCQIDSQDIFQVESVGFLPYEQESSIYSSVKAREILNMIQHLRKLLMIGFYFSYSYDLTLSKMKQAMQCQTDEKYLWNLNLIRNHLKTTIDRKWLTYLIQGYISYFYLYVNGKRLDFYLLSRRSSKRAGTRYNARGIDDDGNVANFVETEQLIHYNNVCCSHVQVRGSVPVFWSQRGYLTETKIIRTSELTKAAFRKHFRDLCEDYSRIICLNLMAKKKSAEQMVTEAYEEQIKLNIDFQNVKYEWFDFHHECKNSDFSYSNPLIRKLYDQIKNFSFYMEDLKTKQVQYVQHGIFRTNCMDCLDRTNFIQAKIAMTIFDIQMKQLGVDFTQLLKMSPIEALDEDSNKVSNYFIQYFKNIWADNGDMLSAQYTGTGSTHTNITRTGKRDVSGMLDHGTKSLMRFYIQNFSDNVKQEAIDVLLGTHTEIVNKFTQETERTLKSRQQEYCDFSERTVLIVTWNLGGATIPTSYDLNKQVLDYSADIIVFGLQEMVTSGTGLVIGSSQYLKDWDILLQQNLKLRESYILVKSKELLGMGLFIYAKDRFKDRITKVSYDTIKLGFLGQVANKGAVIIKMFIDDTLLCFVNCHLEHGQKSLNTRLVNLQDIHSQAFNTIGIGKKKEEKIEQCDYRFLFGDLNFRISLDADKVITSVQRYKLFTEQNRQHEAKEIFNQLLKYDECTVNLKSNAILKNYHEAEIHYLPTYKYEPYSNLYDKNRTPSWTDRVLISQNENMESKYLYYKSHDINYSDHRPVAALINIKTHRENEMKKEAIVKEIYRNDLRLNQEVV